MFLEKVKGYILKYLGHFFIFYGIGFIAIEQIDYETTKDLYEGILTQAYPESIFTRFTSIIYAILLIVAGYLFIKKRGESWILFNIAFLGIIFKSIYDFFVLGIFCQHNFLIESKTHILLAIFGLFIMIKWFPQVERYKWYKFSFLIVLAILIRILFEYQELKTLFEKDNYKAHYEDLVSNTYPFNSEVNFFIDTCLFKEEFETILDTLQLPIQYVDINIIQVDSLTDKPIYKEQLSLYQQDVLGHYYIYDDSLRLVLVYKECERQGRGKCDTLKYTYYENGMTESITEIYYSFTNYDTMKNYYRYIKGVDTIQSSIDRNYPYRFTSYLNANNQETRIEQAYGDETLKFYNNKNRLDSIVKKNQFERESVEIEKYYYSQNGQLSFIESKTYDKDIRNEKNNSLTVYIY